MHAVAGKCCHRFLTDNPSEQAETLIFKSSGSFSDEKLIFEKKLGGEKNVSASFT